MVDNDQLRRKLQKLADRLILMHADLEDIIGDLEESTAIVPLPKPEPSPEHDPDAEPLAKPTRKRNYYPGTVADLVRAGILAPGTELISDSRKYKAKASVDANGKVVYGGKAYDTPTEAGKEVKRRFGAPVVECAGWDFWCVLRLGVLVPLKELRRELNEMKDRK